MNVREKKVQHLDGIATFCMFMKKRRTHTQLNVKLKAIHQQPTLQSSNNKLFHVRDNPHEYKTQHQNIVQFRLSMCLHMWRLQQTNNIDSEKCK